MKKLQPDWFTQSWIDAEYQKYVVMAYLQTVQQNFTAHKLWPDLQELRNHYENGVRFTQDKSTLQAAFPKQMRRVTGPPPRIEYQSDVTEPAYMDEMDTIMTFALPRFQTTLTEGQQRWGDIARSLMLTPIGLLPLRAEEGYLLLHVTSQTETQVYHFCMTIYSDQEPGGRFVKLRFVEAIRKSFTNTFENIKLDLIRRHRHLPNPATFMLESQQVYPVQETLLPIAQQLLVQVVP